VTFFIHHATTPASSPEKKIEACELE